MTRKLLLLLAAMTAIPGVATAQSAQIQRRDTVLFSDGNKIGTVNKIIVGSDGVPTAVQVIYRHKILNLPISSLSAAQGGYQTSLSKDQVLGQ